MSKDNKTIYAILGLLHHEDLTGYDIKKRVDSSLGFFWNAGFGQIYPTLKVMDEKRLVTKNEKIENGRNKITYSITEEGNSELKQWLATPSEKEYVKYEILLKLFFGSMLDVKENINLIDEFKNRNMAELNLLDMYKGRLSNLLETNDDHIYYYLTVLFGEKVYKAYMEWADEAILLLKQNEKQKEH